MVIYIYEAMSIKEHLVHQLEHGQNKILNGYFIMKGVKSLYCLDINNTSELFESHCDNLDFELGPAPY